eukprot:6195865-Pleurochrysis_carterae.AAC.5
MRRPYGGVSPPYHYQSTKARSTSRAGTAAPAADEQVASETYCYTNFDYLYFENGKPKRIRHIPDVPGAILRGRGCFSH